MGEIRCLYKAWHIRIEFKPTFYVQAILGLQPRDKATIGWKR